MPKIFFFQLPKLNKYCLGVELAPAQQVIQKAENGSSEGLHAVSRTMPQRLQNVIKKKGMPVTEILNTCTRYRNKHLLEISFKNKFLIVSYSA